MPADMAEVKVGMDAHTFSKQLRSLSRKTFTTIDGEPRTVLTKVTRGCRGHCPHFEDTLGLMAARGQYPPRNGDPKRPPNQVANGDPKQTPINEFSTLEWGPKTNQLGTQNEPIGDPTGSPIETRQDKHLLADALLPTAERSVGVSQPHKQEQTSDALRVGIGTETARAAAGVAKGRPAAALPSQAEYERVERLLETEGLDALTPEDREVYHEGHAIYAAKGYVAE